MLIYIVEDEERIRELESYALEKNDFEVMSFENSVEFYKALEIRLPDLILLDIMLPGDDGLTILKKLRNNTAYENIPVIIISRKYAPNKSSSHRTQKIDIYYRFDVAVSTAVADSMKYDKKRKVA